jgi:predicted nucleic-acid-binding protein
LIGLDTNILVRYFTHDDARQTPLAIRLVDEQLDPAQPGHVSLVTLVELVWVLRTGYGAERETVADIVNRLLADARFVMQEPSSVWAALDAYLNAPVDFADALIAALDRDAGCIETLTFDRGAARISGVRLLS